MFAHCHANSKWWSQESKPRSPHPCCLITGRACCLLSCPLAYWRFRDLLLLPLRSHSLAEHSFLGWTPMASLPTMGMQLCCKIIAYLNWILLEEPLYNIPYQHPSILVILSTRDGTVFCVFEEWQGAWLSNDWNTLREEEAKDKDSYEAEARSCSTSEALVRILGSFSVWCEVIVWLWVSCILIKDCTGLCVEKGPPFYRQMVTRAGPWQCKW